MCVCVGTCMYVYTTIYVYLQLNGLTYISTLTLGFGMLKGEPHR